MPAKKIKYKEHPIAALFPNPSPKDMTALHESIAAHGLLEPILVTKKMEVLDGRSRLHACGKLEVPVRHDVFKGTDAEAIDVTVARNLHRRHLTIKQKAEMGDRIATMKRGGDQKSKGPGTLRSKDTSIDDAAKQLDVSPTSVKRARKIRTKGTPEIQEAVADDKLGLKEGAAVAGLPAEEQREVAKAADPKAAAKKQAAAGGPALLAKKREEIGKKHPEVIARFDLLVGELSAAELSVLRSLLDLYVAQDA